MKDIAAHFGVSINTVHKAVTGKPGVGDSMRKQILDFAEQSGYRRNASASSLRRKEARIVICLPSPERQGRYYYAHLWEGCRRYIKGARDTGAVFERVEFDLSDYTATLQRLLGRLQGHDADGQFDGLLALAPTCASETETLRAISDSGVPVELVSGDNPQTGRVGAMVADYALAGALMAEQAMNLLRGVPASARTVLLSGDPYVDSHYLVARAFHDSFTATGAGWAVEDLPSVHGSASELRALLLERLDRERPALVCAVYATGTEIMGDCLVKSGLAGSVPAIGNDLFPESVEALRRGIITNLVYKDPIGLAGRAVAALENYVLWGTQPSNPVEMVPVELVFRSNLDLFCEKVALDV